MKDLFKFLMIFGVISFGTAFSDFEDCEVIENTDKVIAQFRNAATSGSQEKISVKLKSGNGDKTKENETLEILQIVKGGLITKGFFPNKQSEFFDGFYCVATKDSQGNEANQSDKESIGPKTSTDPCKKYIHYTEGQPNPNQSNMKCFRGQEKDSSTTSIVIVLNRKLDRDDNIFVKLADLDSHILNSRFLFSTMKFIYDSIKGIVPIMSTDPSQSEYFWINGRNLITEMSNDGKMYVRYRFIDTTTNPEPTEMQRHELIKGAFYLIKRFFYQKKSCKKIIEDAYVDGYLAVLEQDQSFPRNYRHIMMWLEEKCDDKDKLNLTTKDKHKVLLQLTAMAYCKKSVHYDKVTLNSLKELIGSIFNQDQFFTSTKMQNEFKAFFSDSGNMLTTEKYQSKSEEDMLKKLDDEPFLALGSSVVEEPKEHENLNHENEEDLSKIEKEKPKQMLLI